MRKPGSNILKAEDIKFQGSFLVELLSSANAAASTPAAKANVEPQVNVVENQPEFAVIELTCSCGTKTRVKCNYAEMQDQAQLLSQTQNPGEKDNES